MELNITNPHAASLHEALGISEERATELCQYMDRMVAGPPRQINVSVSFEELIGQCDTLEEYTFVVVTHTSWLVRNGRMMFVDPLPYTREKKS